MSTENRSIKVNPTHEAPYGLTPVVASAEDQIVAEAMSKTHMPMYLTGFLMDIDRFNDMYQMPQAEPDSVERLKQFKSILEEECKEIDDIIAGVESPSGPVDFPTSTHLADLLGDIIVYCASEAKRWNIPIDKVLHIIMQSNFSKMGPDGPIYDERGKLLKGPNYWKPEEKIAELLNGKGNM